LRQPPPDTLPTHAAVYGQFRQFDRLRVAYDDRARPDDPSADQSEKDLAARGQDRSPRIVEMLPVDLLEQ
jgi:hypothetical protein